MPTQRLFRGAVLVVAAFTIPVLLTAADVAAGGADIRVTPASISAARLRQPVEFQVELGKAIAAPVLEVDLILAVPGGSPRTLKTRSTDGRVFRVTATPIPADQLPRVRLTLHDGTSEAAFWAADRTFTVGGRPVQLSSVRRIALGDAPQVFLREGPPPTGVIKGLERIEGQVAGTRVQFETVKATRLVVGEIEASAPSVIYRVVVRQKDKVLGERLGLLTVSAAPDPAPISATKPSSSISFLPAAVHKVPGANDIIAAGDLDGDRRPDVVVVANEELGVLYCRSDGTLEPYQTVLTWKGKPSHPVLADLNGDGLPEILFRDNVRRLVVLRNQGDRHFAEPRFQDVGGASAMAIADFNEDGRPDLVLTAADGVKIYLTEADGTLTAQAGISVRSHDGGVAVRDVNGDKHLDLAVGFATSTVGRSGASLFFGDGTGKFTGGGDYYIGSQNMPGVALEDLNGDGKADMAVAHYWSGELLVLFNKGDGTFLPLNRYPAGSYPIQVRSADVNGDGKADLVVPNAGKGQISVFRNRGDGTFHDPVSIPSGGENSRSCAIADFNRDGRPDVVVQHESSRAVGVLLNNTGG